MSSLPLSLYQSPQTVLRYVVLNTVAIKKNSPSVQYLIVSLFQCPPPKKMRLHGPSSSSLSLTTPPSESEVQSETCLTYYANVVLILHSDCATSTNQLLTQAAGWLVQQRGPFDREWIGRTMYAAKGRLVTTLKLWWNPPPVDYLATPPHPDTYHCRRLLLWAPRMMWKVNFHCPHCGVKESLRSKGLYNRVRLVVDMKGMYYLAGEYM